MLVCPGQSTMTLLPMLPTACMMPPPRPSPNASSSTRDTTPQLIPSIVRTERMRLRRSAVQLCTTSSFRYTLHLGSFVAQALDRVHVGGALCRVHAGTHCDQRQRQQRAHNRNGRNDGLGNEVRQGSTGQQQAQPDTKRVAQRPAKNCERDRLAEKLLQNVRLGGANRFEDADLAGALSDRH